MDKMETFSFGEWVSIRRKTLDMTQRDLAAQTNCALATVKKIESDERRPSRDLADAMAHALFIPAGEQQQFVECARGLHPVDALAAANLPDRDQNKSAALPISDLPASVTPLIGRTMELTQIAQLLDQPACRLLTLMGSGGAGKTRLAIEAAHTLRDHFADSAVFVSLSAVADASLIPMSITQSLKLGLSGSAEVQLFAYLRDKVMLLVLDNCEQLVEGISWLSDLLTNAPGIKLLTTSRERLQLTEEWVYAVPVLDETQAIDLFAQSARRLNPHFESHSVSTVCQLVENLPLALELAASWTPFLSCEQIAQNIQQDLDFLIANVRNVPERHRSIRAVFDYSWRLLSSAEQTALMRLSVFRGGWTVEESASATGTGLHMLRALVEKSLVRIADHDRYDLHELTRQYAADKLGEVGQKAEARRLHGETYIKLAEKLKVQLEGSQAISAFARLDQEHDNLRSVWEWLLENGEITTLRQQVDTMFTFWLRRGYWQEAEYWSKTTLIQENEEDNIFLCQTLIHLSTFMGVQGLYHEAAPYLQQALPMARRLKDPDTLMKALMLAGQAVPVTEAPTIFEELLSIWTQMGTEWNKESLANAYNLYGHRLNLGGYYGEAATQFEKSLELFRQLGNVDMIAYPLGNLGRLALREGHLREAYDLIGESVALSRAIGNRVGIADWLQQLGNAAFALSDLDQAEACYEEAMALYEEIGNSRAVNDMLSYLGHIALTRNDLETAARCFQGSVAAYIKFYRNMPKHILGQALWIPTEFFLCLEGTGLLLALQRQDERAVTLFAAIAALRHQNQLESELQLSIRVESAMTDLKARLSPANFNQAWETGQSMSLEPIMVYALETL